MLVYHDVVSTVRVGSRLLSSGFRYCPRHVSGREVGYFESFLFVNTPVKVNMLAFVYYCTTKIDARRTKDWRGVVVVDFSLGTMPMPLERHMTIGKTSYPHARKRYCPDLLLCPVSRIS
jgi:hypothetical protein